MKVQAVAVAAFLMVGASAAARSNASINEVRPAFVAHLEHAKSLQKTLAGK